MSEAMSGLGGHNTQILTDLDFDSQKEPKYFRSNNSFIIHYL